MGRKKEITELDLAIAIDERERERQRERDRERNRERNRERKKDLT